MGFEAHFPAGGSYTANFTPAVNGTVSGSHDEVNDGVTAKLAADQRTLYAQQLAIPATKYVRTFSGLSESERSAEATFRAAVLGAAFDFKDGTCGPVTSYKKVKFAPEGHKLTWQQQAGRRQSIVWVMIDAD